MSLRPPLTNTIIAVTPATICNADIAIAASRAGSLGILDLGACDRGEGDVALRELGRLVRHLGSDGHWGTRCSLVGIDASVADRLRTDPALRPDVLILAGVEVGGLEEALAEWRSCSACLLLETTDLEGAIRAQQVGFDGVVVNANEAGGRVSQDSAFLLLQRFQGRLDIPYWIRGGMGLHSVGAARLAGAAGVVLCEPFWLTRESPFPEHLRAKWGQCDGTETRLIGSAPAMYRLSMSSGREALRRLEALDADTEEFGKTLFESLQTTKESNRVLPMGQDIGLASTLAERFETVGRVVTAFQKAWTEGALRARHQRPWVQDSGLALANKTRYPIVQGPMTRVSDGIPFARAVADAGALPFLALALSRQDQARALLTAAGSELQDRSWGVGILGFSPPELRRQHFDLLRELRPPFALVSGGRPSQVADLESHGIATYLHAPTPGLLRQFLAEGVRRFVLEGRECGGHVGPLTSFALWSQAVETLLEAEIDDPESVHVLFAGGIHDALSAAMTACLAAPLAERGMKPGILMGTGYLFTREAVSTGAVVEAYQRRARDCSRTTLLETGPGYVTRCATTPFCEEFGRQRAAAVSESSDGREAVEALERLNVGRLHLASKGLMRAPGGNGSGATGYVPASAETQDREGLYMLGDVATLRRDVVSMEEFHRDVCEGSTALVSRSRTVLAGEPVKADHGEDIAIVGMACLFPGAAGLRGYWQNILRGFDPIQEVPEERWRADDFFDPDRFARDRVYSRWGGFLDDIAFDPIEYGIPPNSLEAIEPVQLLALSVARSALLDAGFERPDFPKARTAVIFGTGGVHDLWMDYVFRTQVGAELEEVEGVDAGTRRHILESLREHLPEWSEDSFPGVLGNLIAGRISNRLDLGGANYTIDAACAASLAALDAGVKELRSKSADVALVGAVDCANNAVTYMAFSKTQALSPRGRCRPFDDSADGIVISEGVAATVLKRLADAERDGDRIYAVVKGVGASSDGRSSSLTAPHAGGQTRALARAYENAGLPPASVGLIEAHGTGTAVGDPIEVEALTRLFEKGGAAQGQCALGSVKSMIGHTKTAAGLAGVIKTALALDQRILPPTAGIDVPNRRIDFARTPFYLNTEPRPWFGCEPARAGVSAFGFGGANYHAVLEEYSTPYRPSDRQDLTPRGAELFAFQYEGRAALETGIGELLEQLGSLGEVPLAELAGAVHRHRSPTATGPTRFAVVAESVRDLEEKLTAALADLREEGGLEERRGVFFAEGVDQRGRVCFLFPGQGSQKVNMLRDLVASNPAMRSAIDHADEVLRDSLAKPLSRVIYPVPVFSAEERRSQAVELTDTAFAQPALGAVELAALDLLRGFDLVPDFVSGHSFGEWVALCAAGVLSRDDLLQMSAIRGRICSHANAAEAGAMAAVAAEAGVVEPLLEGLSVSVACLNGPKQTVIAGERSDLAQAAARLAEAGFAATDLPVGAAFHTGSMRSAAAELALEMKRCRFERPKLPVLGNATASAYPESEAEIRDMLARHLCEPIRFVEQVLELHDAGARVFIEVGPGSVLSQLVPQILEGRAHRSLSIERTGRDAWTQLAELLAQSFVLGLPVKMDSWFAGRGVDRTSLGELKARVARGAAPPATTWRLNGGRVVPWYEGRPERSAAGGAASTVKRIPATRERADGASRGLARELLDSTIRFRELHEEQQRLTERFLDLQERMARALAGDDPVERALVSERVEPTAAVAGDASEELSGSAAPVTAGDVRPLDQRLPSVAVFRERLLARTSARTGYPESMLPLDAPIEGDLGIDSLKRLEIVAGMEELRELRDLTQDSDDVVFERLATFTTLGQIVDFYDDQRSVVLAQEGGDDPIEARRDGAPELGLDESVEATRRFVLRPMAISPSSRNGRLSPAEDTYVLLVGEGGDFFEALGAGLRTRGHRVVCARWGASTRRVGADDYEVDGSCAESVAALMKFLGTSRKVGLLINFATASTPSTSASALDYEATEDQARRLFLLLQATQDELLRSAANGGSRIVNITSCDGGFGLLGESHFNIEGAGSLGVLKTAAREWPQVKIKCLDLDPGIALETAVDRVLDELASDNDSIEVGLTQTGRWELALEAGQTQPRGRKVELDRESVVLVTGGASGITAEVCKGLAERYQPRLVLVGRSPIHELETDATRSVEDPDELRRLLLEAFTRRSGRVSPAQVEKELQRFLKNRQIVGNLEAIRATGARAEYHALDLQDPAAFAEFIADVYRRHGRIDGVIHGAGVLGDGPIHRKSLANFDRVFRSKVHPAAVLAKSLRSETLQFLVFFSSVVARFGNYGQCDYSAANEVLNKVSSRLARDWPNVHVVSLNWGPWDLGMMRQEMKQFYAEKNISVISTRVGVEFCLDEIACGRSGATEVVVSPSVREISEYVPART